MGDASKAVRERGSVQTTAEKLRCAPRSSQLPGGLQVRGNARRIGPMKSPRSLSVASALWTFFVFATARAETPRVKVSTSPDDGIQPQAAVDSKGVVHLIYFKGDPKGGDIFYIRREPRQNEFSKPIRVNTQPDTAMALGTIRGAQLAVGKNGRVHVAWDGMGG